MRPRKRSGSDREYFVKVDGYDSFLRKSDDAFTLYRLCPSNRLIFPACAASIVLGILWSIFGGILAGVAVWFGWHKYYLPRLLARRLDENCDPDLRFARPEIAHRRSDGRTKLYLGITPTPPSAAVDPPDGVRDAGTWGAGGADPVGVRDADTWGAGGADPVGDFDDLEPAAPPQPAASPAKLSLTIEFPSRASRERFEALID